MRIGKYITIGRNYIIIGSACMGFGRPPQDVLDNAIRDRFNRGI